MLFCFQFCFFNCRCDLYHVFALSDLNFWATVPHSLTHKHSCRGIFFSLSSFRLMPLFWLSGFISFHHSPSKSIFPQTFSFISLTYVFKCYKWLLEPTFISILYFSSAYSLYSDSTPFSFFSANRI